MPTETAPTEGDLRRTDRLRLAALVNWLDTDADEPAGGDSSPAIRPPGPPLGPPPAENIGPLDCAP